MAALLSSFMSYELGLNWESVAGSDYVFGHGSPNADRRGLNMTDVGSPKLGHHPAIRRTVERSNLGICQADRLED